MLYYICHMSDDLVSKIVSIYFQRPSLSLFPHSASARVGLEKNRFMFFFNLRHLFTDLFIVFNPRAPQLLLCVNATFSEFRLFAQNSSLPNINEAFSRHKPPFFTQNWMELLLCYTGVMTLCYGSSNSSSDGGRLNWGRSAWGSWGWYKFRNCLIFPRKGCKKSLEMYRILFLNSSFIHRSFFKRQLTSSLQQLFLFKWLLCCLSPSAQMFFP